MDSQIPLNRSLEISHIQSLPDLTMMISCNFKIFGSIFPKSTTMTLSIWWRMKMISNTN